MLCLFVKYLFIYISNGKSNSNERGICFSKSSNVFDIQILLFVRKNTYKKCKTKVDDDDDDDVQNKTIKISFQFTLHRMIKELYCNITQ